MTSTKDILKWYLNDAKCVVNRSFHFVTVEIIRTTEYNRTSRPSLGSFHEDQLVVGDPLLANLSGLPEEAGLKALLALYVCEGGDELGSGRLGNSLQISLLASPKGRKIIVIRTSEKCFEAELKKIVLLESNPSFKQID